MFGQEPQLPWLDLGLSPGSGAPRALDELERFTERMCFCMYGVMIIKALTQKATVAY